MPKLKRKGSTKKGKTNEGSDSVDTPSTKSGGTKLHQHWAYLAEAIEEEGGIDKLKEKRYSLSKLLSEACKKDPVKREYFLDVNKQCQIQNKVRRWKALSKSEYIEKVMQKYKIQPFATRKQDNCSFRDTNWDSKSSLPDDQASQASSKDSYLTRMTKKESPPAKDGKSNDAKQEAQKAPVAEVQVNDLTKSLDAMEVHSKPKTAPKKGFEWVEHPINGKLDSSS